MILIQVAMFVLLHFVPYRLLQMWLSHQLNCGNYQFEPQFSGRVSLFLIAEKLRQEQENAPHIALLPDYTCNVLHRAFHLAGWQIVTYKTDDLLEANWKELISIIDNQKVTVMVGASVFGSSGLLKYLLDKRKADEFRERNIQVVLDLAQDIRLVSRVPLDCSDFVHVIVSFNDKSFPGAMGGGILSANFTFPRQERLSFLNKINLYKHFMIKLLIKKGRILYMRPKTTSGGTKKHFDYSYCQSFPYRIDPVRPPKLQLILAIIGMFCLPYYQTKKKKLIELDMHLPTCFADSAAYLILRNPDILMNSQSISHLARKVPYAQDRNPNTCLRAEDVIIHNKGFFDFL